MNMGIIFNIKMLWKLSKLCIFSNQLRDPINVLLVRFLDLNKTKNIKIEVTEKFKLWMVFNRLQTITL